MSPRQMLKDFAQRRHTETHTQTHTRTHALTHRNTHSLCWADSVDALHVAYQALVLYELPDGNRMSTAHLGACSHLPVPLACGKGVDQSLSISLSPSLDTVSQCLSQALVANPVNICVVPCLRILFLLLRRTQEKYSLSRNRMDNLECPSWFVEDVFVCLCRNKGATSREVETLCALVWTGKRVKSCCSVTPYSMFR